MVCKACKNKPVIRLTNNNKGLCKSCFIKYFEQKTKKTISKYKLVDKKDHIGVACSGGKDSTAVLYLIHKIFGKRPDIKITAIAVDEGIKGYRPEHLKYLKKFCKELKVNLKIVSFKEEFGKSLDQIIKKGMYPCSICGVLRRSLLNRYSLKLKCTKLVTGHNLDDEAQSILMNQLKNNVKVSARLGPLTGVVKDNKFVPRIKPFYLLTEKEVKAYSFLMGYKEDLGECPYADIAFRNDVRSMLNEFENKHEGTKHSVVLSFLEVLPLLKNKYRKGPSINYCSRCKEPCSKESCKVCDLVKELKLKV